MSVNAASGVATFDDVVVTQASSAHTLQATAGGLTVVSLPFAITPAAANGAQSDVTSAAMTFLSNTPQAMTFTFRDTYGNVIPKAAVSLTSSLPGASFSPGSGTSGTDGTFMSNYRGPAGSATMSATVNGTAVSLGQSFTVTDACAPVSLNMPGSATGTFVRGDGCLVNGNPTVIRQFTMPSPGGATPPAAGAAFRVEAFFGASFEVRSNPAAQGIVFFTDSITTIEWLLFPGQFQFHIGAPFVGGTYSLASSLVPANTGDRVRTLLAPGVYTGQSLASGDSYDGTWYSDFFFFADDRPCTITLRSTAFDAVLIIINATTGDLVGFDQNSGGGTDAQIVRASCRSVGQPIAIGASSAFADEVGPYTLTVAVQGAAAVSSIVQPDAPVRPITSADIRNLMRRASASRRKP
jgi:hypothetical protein